MKLYKVLNRGLVSPYKEFQYELGKEYVCDDFNDDSDRDCAEGFYATDLDGLSYAWIAYKGKSIYEVEVGGKSIEYNEFKRRYEQMTIIKECDIEKEIIPACKEIEEDVGYKLSEVIQPIHPLKITPPEITAKHIELVKQWNSVWNSVCNSVRDSVCNSVRNSVWCSVCNSVWNSVKDSVWDSVCNLVWDSVWYSMGNSVYVYIGNLFNCIDDWKYVDHNPGEYPFQSAIDLWYEGLVPSYDGKTWRLHGGENAEILWKGEF